MLKFKNWYKKLVLSIGIASFGIQPIVAQHEEVDTAIIGAGLAGLTAGFYLPGEFKIYEGRDRAGGRVFTDPRYGELGGQDLYEGHHPASVEKLCHDLSLQINLISQPPSLYTTQSHENLDTLIKEEVKEVDDLLVKQLMEQEGYSLKDFLDAYFDTHPITPKLRRYIDIKIRNVIGGSPEQADYYYGEGVFKVIEYFLNAHPRGEEGYPYLPGGNSTIINTLIEHEKIRGKVEYSKTLTSIDQEGEKIKLVFRDGHEVLAHHVILALPFSTLRYVAIQPGLIPVDQSEIIRTLPYGTNSKILVPVHVPESATTRSTINEEGVSWFNPGKEAMTLFYGGPAGENLTETNAAEYITTANQTLQAVYGELREGEPKVVNWSQDPYSLGSYSYKAPGQLGIFSQMGKVVSGHESIDMPHIVRPIGSKIIFAGEHTVKDESAGSMDGAIESGMVAAKTLELLEKGGHYEAPSEE